MNIRYFIQASNLQTMKRDSCGLQLARKAKSLTMIILTSFMGRSVLMPRTPSVLALVHNFFVPGLQRKHESCFSLTSFQSWNLIPRDGEQIRHFSRHQHRGTSLGITNSETSREEMKTIESEWNVKELVKETQRLILRCQKKIGKASTRYQQAMEVVNKLTAEGAEPTLSELDACPDVASIELELKELRERLNNLNNLQERLAEVQFESGKRSHSVVLPQDVAILAIDLQVNDAPPKRHAPIPKKKNPTNTNGPRKPYRTYFSKGGIEIRVGKRAEDNDQLSTNPEHRDGNDWWMHASGCPGSHVVIRSHNNLDDEVIKDAAALAARQSKCTGNIIKVSLTKCRDVTKPRGAKPGLVQLHGPVRTVVVNMREAQSRLERLDESVQI